jgi:dynein heavy chain
MVDSIYCLSLSQILTLIKTVILTLTLTSKNSCEADLAEAIPALEAAERALKSLKKDDITEMKAMKKPSQAIKMTMAAVSIMMDVKPDKKVKDGDPRIDPYWGPASKELLNDAKFLNRLG